MKTIFEAKFFNVDFRDTTEERRFFSSLNKAKTFVEDLARQNHNPGLFNWKRDTNSSYINYEYGDASFHGAVEEFKVD